MTTRYWPPSTLRRHSFSDPLYLVAPFLPYGGIGVLHGPPGVGKSQLALTMCIAVTQGAAFLAPDYVTTPGGALYVQLNMTPRLQQERLTKAGVPSDGVAFLTLEDGQLDSTRMVPARDAGLHDAKAAEPSLIVVDTLRDAHNLDEMESGTVVKVYEGWRNAFPGAALLFIHHDRKLPLTNGGAPPERYWSEAARGSSTWVGNADVGLHLTDAKGALTLFFSKIRTCGALGPHALTLSADTLLMELAEPNARQKLLSWLSTNPTGKRKEAITVLEQAGVGRSRAFDLVKEYMGSGNGRSR